VLPAETMGRVTRRDDEEVDMTGRTWMARGLTLAAAAFALAAMPPAAVAQSLDIEGLWLVQVQLRNSQTQAPLGAPFNSVVSFIADGNIVEATEAPAFAPGQRPPAHGRWTRLGPRTFSQQLLALIAFDTPPNPPVSPGFVRGGSVVSQTIEMSSSTSFTSSGTNGFYDASAQLYRSGCSTATGQRFFR
jgi:hypothetical protein